MSLPVLIILGAILYGLAIRAVLGLCRAAAIPTPPLVPPSAEVLAEMRRRQGVA